MKIVSYRPAYVTGFDREDDIVDPWDEKLTADSNAHWFKEWIEEGNVLTFEREPQGKYFKSKDEMLQHYVMGEKPGSGERWICALVREKAPPDWKWLE